MRIRKDRSCIVDQSEAGKQPVEGPVARIDIEAHRGRLVLVGGRGRIRQRRTVRAQLRTRWGRKLLRSIRRGQGHHLLERERRRPDQLSYGLFVHAETQGDLPVADALLLELTDETQTPGRYPPPAGPPARTWRQGLHASQGIAPLRSPHGAYRAPEGQGHFLLLREPGVHQEHHRVGFGHDIVGPVVMNRQPFDRDHPLIPISMEPASTIDDDRVLERE
jgi:hypothetical protein